MQIPNYIKKRIVFKDNKVTRDNAVPEIDYLEPAKPHCRDCGKKCGQRVITHEWIPRLKAFNESCSVCNCYRDPESGDFIFNKTEAKTAIKQEFKKRDK